MKSYLITVITVSICIGIYNIISPAFGSIAKYNKMIGMLIVLCVIISPLQNIMNFFTDDGLSNIKENIIDGAEEKNSKYDEIFNDYLSYFSIEEVKGAIGDILLEEFDVPKDECDVSITTENTDGKLKISHLQILLSGKSIFKNPYEIEEYFGDLLNCNCNVLIK